MRFDKEWHLSKWIFQHWQRSKIDIDLVIEWNLWIHRNWVQQLIITKWWKTMCWVAEKDTLRWKMNKTLILMGGKENWWVKKKKLKGNNNYSCLHHVHFFFVVQKRPFHIMKKNSFLWELLCYSFAMTLFFHVFVLKIVLQFLCPLWHLSVGNASLKCLKQINDGDGFAESDTWQQCREREKKNVVAWIKPGHQVISATAKWWYINLTTNSIVIHFISNAAFFFIFSVILQHFSFTHCNEASSVW